MLLGQRSPKKLLSEMESFRSGLMAASEQATFDARRFIETLRIKNETGDMVPLIMRPAQEEVWRHICEAEDSGKPVRLLIGKIRQLGISTLVAGVFFAKCWERSNQSALIVAHVLRSAEWIYYMSRLFYESLPDIHRDKRPLRGYRPTADTIQFESPHNSSITIATAESVQVARGTTLQWLHASEVAFWRKPDELMTSLKPAIHELPGTGIILESTWNGRNFFDRQFMKAVEGENEYTALFLGLKDYPVYSIPMKRNEKLDLTSDEREYQEEHGIPDPLMKFVIRTKRGPTCNNEWALFNREYPVSIDVARSESGWSVFDQIVLTDMLKNDVRTPLEVGSMDFIGDYLGSGAAFVPREHGHVEIWEHPSPDGEYILCLDVSEGTGGDFSVCQIFKIIHGELDVSLEQVAKLHTNRLNTWEASLCAYQLGVYFRYALAVVESNAQGLLAAQAFHGGFSNYPQTSNGYPNMHVPIAQTKNDGSEMQKLGWSTTAVTKPIMIGSLARRIRERTIKFRSERTLNELAGFYCEQTSNGRTRYLQRYRDPVTNRGHDDEVMAAGLATGALKDALGQVRWLPRAQSGRF